MNDLIPLLGLAIPVAMAVGAVAAWRMTRGAQRREEEAPAWRDDSLDEWRRERDDAAAAERAARTSVARDGLTTGQASDEGETRKHQRIGG